MHALHTILIAASTSSTTTSKSSSKGSSYLPLLVIILVFAAIYIFFIRPRQQRMRQQQTTSRQLGIGDPVVSAGGIQGKVVALDADVVEVEVAPGVVLTFLRRAINLQPNAARPPEPEVVDDDWHMRHDEDDGPPPAGDR